MCVCVLLIVCCKYARYATPKIISRNTWVIYVYFNRFENMSKIFLQSIYLQSFTEICAVEVDI